MDRSGGHLALGDLNMLKQNFPRAEEEFQKAIELDKTPLSRSNLAALYLTRGLLPEALAQLRKIDENKDESWMYFYGLNREQFTLDLYRQYHQTFKGLSHQTRLLGEWKFKKKISRVFKQITYRVKSLYYKILYRVMALKEGQSQLEGGSALRGNLTLADAARGFPPLAGKYYEHASALEVFHQASPWYDLELGREYGDMVRLKKAYGQFDPLWEGEPMEIALREMALLQRSGNPLQKDLLLLRLYDRNPGGLLQYGLRLPLSLRLSGTEISGRTKRKIHRLLKKSGFILRSDQAGLQGESLILRINAGDVFGYSLTNAEGVVLVSGSITEDIRTRGILEQWVYSFRSRVFFP